MLDAGWEIGFHPAALVWHHRRPGLRPYIRQQVGYGRAEALVERRHPDRFTAIGSARWRGRIYNSLVPSAARPRIYRGLYGAAAYQSIYGGGGHGLDIAHQMGMPLAVLAVLLAPLGLIGWWGLAPAACGLAWIVALGAVDFALVRIPTEVPAPGARFRALVAACHLLQPLARSFARMREQVLGWRDGLAGPALPPARAVGRGVFVYPDAHGRPALVSSIVAAFRADRTRVLVPSGWEGFDARLAVGVLVAGELLSSAYPEGCVQVRVRIRGRLRRGLVAGVLLALAWLAAPVAGAVLSLLVAVDVGRGVLRCTVGARRVLEGRGPGRRASEGPGW